MEKLVELFKVYLKTQKVSLSSIKSYATDLRNFLEWFTLYLKTRRLSFNQNDPVALTSFITQEKIELYKKFLINNKTLIKTINRRLSALRKFGSFAVFQQWLVSNPAKNVANVDLLMKPKQEERDLKINKFLSEFENDLKREKVSLITIKNYLVDIRQFLHFLAISN